MAGMGATILLLHLATIIRRTRLRIEYTGASKTFSSPGARCHRDTAPVENLPREIGLFILKIIIDELLHTGK
jgi:hypothetical protein